MKQLCLCLKFDDISDVMKKGLWNVITSRFMDGIMSKFNFCAQQLSESITEPRN